MYVYIYIYIYIYICIYVYMYVVRAAFEDKREGEPHIRFVSR